MVRAFIAVDISQEARDALAEVVERLKVRGVSGVRWLRPEGIHLTLKFLGDIDPSRVDEILGAMERVAQGTGSLTFSLSELGAFPNPDRPRVIWVGLKGDLDPLGELQARIDQEMHLTEGFPREDRSFTPHLTLGRVRDNLSGEERRQAGKALTEVALEAEASWEVKEVILVRSTLTPGGAVYQQLGSRRL